MWPGCRGGGWLSLSVTGLEWLLCDSQGPSRWLLSRPGADAAQGRSGPVLSGAVSARSRWPAAAATLGLRGPQPIPKPLLCSGPGPPPTFACSCPCDVW